MKTFTQFLIEKSMPVDRALQILGLSRGFSQDEFNKAFKAAVRANHPDLGGDVEKMKLVNLAGEVLKSMAGQAQKQADYAQARADWEAKAKHFEAIAIDALRSIFNPFPFIRHFEQVFGEPFQNTKLNITGDKYYHNGVTMVVEFANSGRSIVAELSVYISITNMMNSKAIASPESLMDLSVYTEILVNRKKVKLTRNNYQYTNRKAIFTDPNVLFPAAKLKAQAAKDANRKLSKRDILLTFEKELKARVDNEYVSVPMSGDVKVVLYRMVFMRAGAWGFNGVYLNHKKVAQGPVVSIYEDGFSLNFLVDGLKALQQSGNTDPQDINRKLIDLATRYKAERPKE